MEETSLDDFRDASGDGDAAEASADAAEESAAGRDECGAAADRTEDSAAADSVGTEPIAGRGSDEPAVEAPTVTAAWSPGGGTCAACGETVDRRWREGDALVCSACKAW